MKGAVVAKQVICIRKDLELADEELALFVAHASNKVFFSRNKSDDRFRLEMDLDVYMVGWLEGKAKKEIKWLDNETQLKSYTERLQEQDKIWVTPIEATRGEENVLFAVVVGPNAADGKIDSLLRAAEEAAEQAKPEETLEEAHETA